MILTVEQAVRLSEARELLRELGGQLRGGDGFTDGLTAAMAQVADDAIFEFVNVAGSYGLCPVAEAFVHTRNADDRRAAIAKLAMAEADATREETSG